MGSAAFGQHFPRQADREGWNRQQSSEGRRSERMRQRVQSSQEEAEDSRDDGYATDPDMPPLLEASPPSPNAIEPESGRRRSSRIGQRGQTRTRATEDSLEEEHKDEDSSFALLRPTRYALRRIERPRTRESQSTRTETLISWHTFQRRYLTIPNFSRLLRREAQSCAICSTDYEQREDRSPVKLPCEGRHVICLGCARRWFNGREPQDSSTPKQTNACPMCRQKLFAYEESDVGETEPRNMADVPTMAELLNGMTNSLLDRAFHDVLGDVVRDAYDRFNALKGRR